MIRLEDSVNQYYAKLSETKEPMHRWAYTIVTPEGYSRRDEITASTRENAAKKAQHLAGYRNRIIDVYQLDDEVDDGEQLSFL